MRRVMSELVPRDDVPQDEEALLPYLIELVEQGRRAAAVQVNATLTMTYWLVGRAVSIHALRDGRADYGKQIVASAGRQLSDRFGSGFGRSNLARMISFARTYPDYNETLALAHRLTWTHIRDLLSLKSDEARAFYAEEASSKRLSVRELRAAIARKAYERREIANSQIPEGLRSPATHSAIP
jgi:hypothetical protein